MRLRKTAAWMAQLDDRILEYIAEESWSSPAIMARSAEFSASEARLAECCRMLVYAGFLVPIHAEMYELTT